MAISNDDLNWEEVPTGAGNWIKFEQPGANFTGAFIAYDAAGGTTFDGDPCGEALFADVTTDDLRRLTLDKNTLRDGFAASQLRPGDVLRIVRGEDAESKNGRTYQTFTFSVARGAAKQADASPEGF